MALLTKRVEGAVLVIELGRADKGNALNRALQQELASTWQEFDDADDQRVAVLHGAASVFSIGHDVQELASDESASPLPDERLFPLHITKPVIAAIEGPCYGLAFELALACDLRFAAEGAMFGFADPNLYVPYRVASVLLPRMTFLGKSLELILAGRILSAAQMNDAGLVSEVSANGAAARAALEAARAMAQRFPSARAFRKREIWRLSGMPLPAAMSLARTLRT